MARLQAATGASSALAGHWGDPPPLPSALAQAALEGNLAGSAGQRPQGRLAAALARLGRAFIRWVRRCAER